MGSIPWDIKNKKNHCPVPATGINAQKQRADLK
jgi:hypothetical protein